MMRTLRVVIFPIFALLVSLLISTIVETTILDKSITWISTIVNADVYTIKGTLKVLLFVFIVFPLGFQSIRRGNRSERFDEMLCNYGLNQLERIAAVLNSEYVNANSANEINIRVYRKKGGNLIYEDMEGFCVRKFGRKLKYSIRNREGLAVDCLVEGCDIIEMESGDKDEYMLQGIKKIIARQQKFVVGIPICSANGNSHKRVICFDSYRPIKIKEGKKEKLLDFCKQAAYDINGVLDGK